MFWSNEAKKVTTDRDRALLCDVADAMVRASQAFRERQRRAQMEGVRLNGYGFRCHSICRALAIVFPECRVVDGKCAGIRMLARTNEDDSDIQSVEFLGVAHSWILTQDDAIIDPYPPGCLVISPMLVVTRGTYVPFGGNLYVPDPSVTRRICDRNLWKESQRLAKMMK